LSDGQYGLRARVADPYAFSLPLRIDASGHYLDGEEALFVAAEPTTQLSMRTSRAGGEFGAGFYPTLLLGVFLDVGFDVIESHSPRPTLTSSWVDDGKSSQTWARLSFERDTRDSPLLPMKGYRLNFSVQGSADSAVSDYSYLKLIARGSFLSQLGFQGAGHVLRLNLFGGAILGDAPYFERFFVGDLSSLVPARALSLNFSTINSPDHLSRGADALSYESMMAGFGVEYAAPLSEVAGLFRLEFFIGGGVFGMTSPDDLPGSREVSIAKRVTGQSRSAESFPVALTFDLGLRAETAIGIFGFSFANGLALIPY